MRSRDVAPNSPFPPDGPMPRAQSDGAAGPLPPVYSLMQTASKNGSNRSLAPDPAEAEATENAARHAFAKAREGDRAAYGQIVRLYQDRLFNAVLRMTGDRDEAAELTQEAFTRALEKIGDFRGDSGPYTWLFRIAMNATVSRLRRAGRRKTVSYDADNASRSGRRPMVDSFSSEEPGPDMSLRTDEARKQVAEALARLDTEYRALLVMRDLEGFDYKQMADLLEMPLGTLKSRLFRARVALRDELRGYFDTA